MVAHCQGFFMFGPLWCHVVDNLVFYVSYHYLSDTETTNKNLCAMCNEVLYSHDSISRRFKFRTC